ncbi:MAG: glycosyltransferase [Solirubrobacteraceae bacterium]
MARVTAKRRRGVAGKRRADERLRVLHVIGYLSETGGAERFVVGLATHLSPERFASVVCAPRGAEPGARAALQRAGIPVVTLGRRTKWDIHRMAGLVELIRREQFHIVHTHLFGSNLWGSLLARSCRVPVIIAHEHTWSYQGNPVRAFLDGHVIGRAATRFIAVSSLDAERMVSIEHVPAQKVSFIPPPFVPRDRDSVGDVRAELGLARDTPLIGTACVLRPQKALHVLVDAYALVRAQVRDAQLVIAGRGECRAALEQQVARLGLWGSVHFLGRRTDVDAILRALDVAAMSSAFEGTPLFALECMAAGTPLVATGVGGLPDVIEHGRSGLLVPPGDPHSLAASILALLADPSRRRRYAQAAGHELERYSISSITERFADLYQELAGAAGIRSGAWR